MTTTRGTSTTSTWSRAEVVRIVAVGLVAGFLSGIFGVGGGILIVPALVLALGIDQRLAHGTSLAAVIPIALSGTVGYAIDDKIDWAAAACLVLGAATLGAVIGTHLLNVLPRRELAIAFAVVLALTAIRMVVDSSDAAGRGDFTVGTAAVLLCVGVLAGTLAGLLGVGGGIVMVPAMVLLVGIPAVIAKGTSLAVIIPTAIVGTRRNLARGNADLRLASLVGGSGVISSFLASRISLGLDEQVSNRLFAPLLVVVAVKMGFDEVRRQRQDARTR
ncbi:MAG: sulfite exporter TauE/SafE family protein [Actinomycetota bacterium]